VTNRVIAALILVQLILLTSAGAQNFQHVVIIVQENRTPDNLFQGLCSPSCGPYNIQQTDWKNLDAPGGTTEPHAEKLAGVSNLGHSHHDFSVQYDDGKMDGADLGSCAGTCPPLAHFGYVQPSDVQPYLTMAAQYGWANYMFQTNQGPSAPAHHYLFGGTSAPSAADDASGIFSSENEGMDAGCLAPRGTLTQLIIGGLESPENQIYPCFEHTTMADLGLKWRYYTPGVKNIWTAPVAIDHICHSKGRGCSGDQWSNVIINPTHVLTDIANGNLTQLSWVIPTGQNSDHPGTNKGGGPAWVASIVNAIGKSPYWKDTAIIVTWDDWGGCYDHEPPILNGNGYEGGFRVPLLFISAYTSPGIVSNVRYDVGSVLRFVEGNFGFGEGILGFADARATSNLSEFYDLRLSPRGFRSIAAPLGVDHFLLDHTPPTDPDDD
jgi:phospholipase C